MITLKLLNVTEKYIVYNIGVIIYKANINIKQQLKLKSLIFI